MLENVRAHYHVHPCTRDEERSLQAFPRLSLLFDVPVISLIGTFFILIGAADDMRVWDEQADGLPAVLCGE